MIGGLLNNQAQRKEFGLAGKVLVLHAFDNEDRNELLVCLSICLHMIYLKDISSVAGTRLFQVWSHQHIARSLMVGSRSQFCGRL